MEVLANIPIQFPEGAWEVDRRSCSDMTSHENGRLPDAATAEGVDVQSRSVRGPVCLEPCTMVHPSTLASLAHLSIWVVQQATNGPRARGDRRETKTTSGLASLGRVEGSTAMSDELKGVSVRLGGLVSSSAV